MADSFAPTARTKLKRRPQRGHFDRKTVYGILDSALVCHLGHVIDGHPRVTPTAYWREGDALYWHGSAASPMLRAMEQGGEICLTVAILDGLVLARSAFHHSLNYRSVMVFGKPYKVEDPVEKKARMEAFLERLYPGRWDELERLRPVRDEELKAITILGLHMTEASAKVRSGPPVDDEEDYTLPIWAGVVPVQSVAGTPEDDGRPAAGTKLPAGLTDLSHLGLGKRR
jgi:uncharacterized protein